MTTPKEIRFYTDNKGNVPFEKWLNGLRDKEGRQRILARLKRLSQGNYGDCKSVGKGVSELRMFFGPGYRVYFGERKGNIIILLYGGNKRSQDTDIIKAQQYWQEYLSYEKNENT